MHTLFSTIRRNQINNFIQNLLQNNTTAFYTIEDVKQVKEGYLADKHKFLNIFNHRSINKK